jgi:hypothetical protein
MYLNNKRAYYSNKIDERIISVTGQKLPNGCQKTSHCHCYASCIWFVGVVWKLFFTQTSPHYICYTWECIKQNQQTRWGKWMNELSYEQIAQNFAFVKEKGIIMISQSFQSLNKRTSKGSIEPAADIWIPSPAHKLQISAIATGEVLHNTAVAKVIVVA